MAETKIAIVFSRDELAALNGAAAERLASSAGATHRGDWLALFDAKVKLERALKDAPEPEKS